MAKKKPNAKAATKTTKPKKKTAATKKPRRPKVPADSTGTGVVSAAPGGAKSQVVRVVAVVVRTTVRSDRRIISKRASRPLTGKKAGKAKSSTGKKKPWWETDPLREGRGRK